MAVGIFGVSNFEIVFFGLSLSLSVCVCKFIVVVLTLKRFKQHITIHTLLESASGRPGLRRAVAVFPLNCDLVIQDQFSGKHTLVYFSANDVANFNHLVMNMTLIFGLKAQNFHRTECMHRFATELQLCQLLCSHTITSSATTLLKFNFQIESTHRRREALTLLPSYLFIC